MLEISNKKTYFINNKCLLTNVCFFTKETAYWKTDEFLDIKDGILSVNMSNDYLMFIDEKINVHNVLKKSEEKFR